MEDIFITKINIKTIRHLRGISIELDDNERKHLIITGKNGSGKTSLLETIRECFNYNKILSYPPTGILVNNQVERNLTLIFSNSIGDYFKKGEYILTYFGAKRNTSINIPKGLNKITTKDNYGIDENANQIFLQYIVNLKAEKSFARDDGDNRTVSDIDNWFNKFENNLKKLFEDDKLKLFFDRKQFNFFLEDSNKNKVSFNQLSDGFSSVIAIITELIVRMENKSPQNYNLQGLVLIDEIETHLHIDLQKKILPFLCDFFPNIQFIVTTHSPFVISSNPNAVVFDLENQIRIEDATGYSYDTIIESYFDSNKYSLDVIQKVDRYEQLFLKKKSSIEEQMELDKLKDYFDRVPLEFAPELKGKLQEIRLQKLAQ